MTHIIVLPSLLPDILPKASTRSPTHIRLFCQILNYNASTFTLIVGKIPMLSSADNKPIDIKVKGLLASLNTSLGFELGHIIEVEGLFDGKKVDPISICEVQWLDVTVEKLKLLEYMSLMEVM